MRECWVSGVCVGRLRADDEREIREETEYCSPTWDCGKDSLV